MAKTLSQSARASQKPAGLATTCDIHRPKPDTMRLWTIQPPFVWTTLQAEGRLLVDPNHPDVTDSIADFGHAYRWMREQMAKRIPGYTGNLPWWAYEHFLDLRRYRWHTLPQGQPWVRLELAVPNERVLLSAYGAWHYVLGRGYLPESIASEGCDWEEEAWQEEAARHGIHVNQQTPLVEPWETRLQASWERVFDVEARRSTETIQATFERLELAEVVRVTEFTT